MTRRPQTLLLIEDFVPDRELYRRCLMADAEQNYRLLEADSMMAGLALCRSQSLDAILLDYALPDGNGLEFIQALQAQSNGGSPPVVMVTGEGNERIAVQAIKLGAEDYLVKQDLTPELLQLTMRSVIKNRQLQQQLKQTEAELKAANEQITTIWESMTDAYTALDRDWRFVYTNPASTQAIRRLTHQKSEEFLGKTHWEMLPWTVGTIVEREYRRAMAEQVAVHFEFFYEPSEDWFEVHAYPSQAGLGIYFRNISDRKRTEAIVQQHLAEIESIYTTAPVGLGFINTNLRFVRINEQLAQIDGLTVSEHLGRTLREILPEMADQLEPLYRQVIESGEPIFNLEVEGTNRAQPGVLRHWLVSYYPQKDSNQRVFGVNVMVQEISDRVRNERDRRLNEQRLQESEAQLKLGVQVAGVALARFDYATNTVALSPEAAVLYGIDELTVTRDRIHSTFHPDDRAELAQIIEQVIDPAGSGWFARDHRVVWQNGEVRWLSVRKQVFFDRSGETPRPDYAILAAIDVTDRKQLQEALQQSKEQLHLIADTIPQIVWTTDPYGETDYVNQRWTDYTGLTVEQASEYGWQNLLHSDDLPAVRAFWSEACQTASVYEIEYRLRRADGVYRWHLVKGLPLRNEQGQVIKWFGTCTDIHNQKQAEAERNQLLLEAEAACEEAEAANRDKDEFVAVVAHELRSPLNAISGWAKLLQTRKFDEGTLSKALDTIWRNTQTQVQLIEDLLDISRLVKGTLQINSAPVNLTQVIEAVLDNIRPMAEAKNIELQPYLTVTPLISGDFNRLQQIVVNLLNNAIKFTPSGGRVEMALEQVDTAVQLRVRDTGKGIAPEFLPQVFERFKQGQKNTGSQDGLGLGLAIVKNLVELHGGTISAESAGTDQGTTFTLRFPRLEVPAIDQSRSTPPLHQSSLTGIRILAVDDEPDMLSLIRFVLQDFGAEVESVTTATAAIDCLSQFKPDILISDLAMPGRDGYELVQQVKSQPEGQIPAIALTSYASATYEERSLQAGFQQHLTKPVDPEDLVTAILDLIGARNYK